MSKVESKKCSQCGAPVESMAATCKFCGAGLEIAQNPQPIQQQVVFVQPQTTQQYVPTYKTTKNKVAAGILGILLGGFGIHKFYLGKIWQGILYLLFCWTYIPAILGLIEGIIILTSSDEKFSQKYGKLQ